MSKARAALLTVLAAVLVPALAAQTTTGYKVVVNATNPVRTLSRVTAMRMFLKKVTTWPDGHPAIPVDQPAGSVARKAFTTEVLKKDTNEVVAYWNQMIFSGRGLPPVSKSSDADVLSYVRENPHAIGYVSGDAKLGEGVKAIGIE
jgi:ABC-type phosphate transport system substrate-binding protein